MEKKTWIFVIIGFILAAIIGFGIGFVVFHNTCRSTEVNNENVTENKGKDRVEGKLPLMVCVDGKRWQCNGTVNNGPDIDINAEQVIMGVVKSVNETIIVRETTGGLKDNQANFAAALGQPWVIIGDNLYMFFSGSWYSFAIIED